MQKTVSKGGIDLLISKYITATYWLDVCIDIEQDNAGVMNVKYRVTEDNLESQFQIVSMALQKCTAYMMLTRDLELSITAPALYIAAAMDERSRRK